MPQKHYRPARIIAKLRQAEVLLARGRTLLEVVKTLGVHEVTYYRRLAPALQRPAPAQLTGQ